MDTYTINATEYVVTADTIYRKLATTHGLDDIDPGQVYLYDGLIAKLNHRWSSVEVVPIHRDSDSEGSVVAEDDFTEARAVERVMPDGVEPCPECGEGWIGSEDVTEGDSCLHCGWGLSG